MAATIFPVLDEDQVVSNTFLIRKKEYCVSIKKEKIEWKRLNDENTVSVRNILSVKVPAKKNVTEFTMFYAKRIENASNPNKWKLSTRRFQNRDINVCQMWKEIIQRMIDGEHIYININLIE